MLIQLKQVSRYYRMGSTKIAALNRIGFDVNHGEFVAVMGPSGSGKSTLLNVLGCLHKPSEGKYLLSDVDVETLSDRELADVRNHKIGFVFQSFNLFSYMTASKNVQVPMIYNGSSKTTRLERSLEVLDLVGLKDRVDHRPGELSGGQQQRVAIARALVTNPALLLADEPTGNLDSVSGRDIMALFSRLNEQDMTIIMVTHQESVARFTHRTITLKDGRISSDGPCS
jgi:putative ABC transport system ATP-binding protein